MMQDFPGSDFSETPGVLLYDTSSEVDDILTASLALIRARGLVVGGLLQRFNGLKPNGKPAMWLEDIASGNSVRLDTPQSFGDRSCGLNPHALAQAACMLRRASERRPDLIIVNRFGKAEADGAGMRPEIADAVASGAPVLIPVRFSLLSDLEGFLGGPASLLLPSPEAIADWAEHAVTQRRSATARCGMKAAD